jgi:hypothetical protein
MYFVDKLHKAAVERIGRPLTLDAARKLADAVNPGDVVMITTGWFIPFWLPRGEDDGPIGSIAVARAIRLGLKGKPLLLSEEPIVPVLEAGCRAAGLRTFDMENFKKLAWATSAQSFPIEASEAKKKAKTLIDNLNPSAVIAIEKCGPNEKGVYHSGLGYDMSDSTAKADYLIEEAKARGILTIGVGDVGDEIGMGLIHDTVKQVVPYGAKCRCGCGGGMATVSETDSLVVATKCNWGGYGLEAALSAVLGNPEVLHDTETEKRIHWACLKAGIYDGMSLQPTFTVCGVPIDVTLHLIELMRSSIKMGFVSISPEELGRH